MWPFKNFMKYIELSAGLAKVIAEAEAEAGKEAVQKFLRILHFAIKSYTRLDSFEWETEKQAEDWVITNWRYIPAVSKLFLLKRQYSCDSGRIDILAADNDAFVIIELKHIDNFKQAIGQTISYMTAITRRFGKSVRGIIITNSLTEKAKEMAKYIPKVSAIGLKDIAIP